MGMYKKLSKIRGLLQNSYLLIPIFIAIIWEQIYFNPTISVPRGYYFTYKTNNFSRNDFVLICITDKSHINTMRLLQLPDTKNSCPGNTPCLLKKIIGIPNDIINITPHGITINHQLLPNSKSINLTQQNIYLHPLKPQKIILGFNQYFVLGDSKNSYDSRYFGIVPINNIYRKALLLKQQNKPFFY